MTDPHTVLCAEDFGAGGDRLAADVVVHRGTNGHRDPLDQMPWALYPSGDEMDCDVAVSRRATTCVLRIRNSSRIEIDGPAALLARAAPRWLTVYGSVLHCWVAAGMPIDLLGDAVVAAGRYYVGVTRRERHFSVAGRANVQVQRSRPTAAMSHAA